MFDTEANELRCMGDGTIPRGRVAYRQHAHQRASDRLIDRKNDAFKIDASKRLQIYATIVKPTRKPQTIRPRMAVPFQNSIQDGGCHIVDV
jgi:hypothetical protein